MAEFTLGVLGGCLSHQRGVPPSQLYHRRLARQLRARGAGPLRVRIARDFEQSHVARLEQLLHTAHLDGVLVHVRSEFTRKASLITIQVRADGIHYYWHPFLLRQRQYGWAEVEAQQFSTCREMYRRLRPSASHELTPGRNSAASGFSGVSAWCHAAGGDPDPRCLLCRRCAGGAASLGDQR